MPEAAPLVQTREQSSRGIPAILFTYCSRSFQVWSLGLTIVIGGAYFSWNKGLNSGFGTFCIATILIGSAYICLILSTSEITSAFPFAGGAYGLARCTIGFFPGFLIGCTEAFQYIIYVSVSTLALVSMLSDSLCISSKFQPFMALLCYFVYASVHIRGGTTFWKANTLLGVVSLSLILLFCVGSLKWVDFTHNVIHEQPLFVNGMLGFMRVLPLPAWFFVGVESLSFVADMVEQDDPKIVVPKGSISCVLTLLIIAIWVMFVCSSLPPGVRVIANEKFPLNAGFTLMFSCSTRLATLLSIPATFATAYGFVFSFGKLLQALTNSKLLPDMFSKTVKPQATPFTAIILGSTISYIICLSVFFLPRTLKYLFNVCMIGAFVSYCTQCIGYLYMRTKFSRVSRLFRSPFGGLGALYAFLIFFFGIVSAIGFQEDNYFAFISVLFIWGAFSLYYFLYAKNRQIFSDEEQKVLLVAHVINHNIRSAARRKAMYIQKGHGSSLNIIKVSFSESIWPNLRKRLSFNHSKVLQDIPVQGIQADNSNLPKTLNTPGIPRLSLHTAIVERKSSILINVQTKVGLRASSRINAYAEEEEKLGL